MINTNIPNTDVPTFSVPGLSLPANVMQPSLTSLQACVTYGTKASRPVPEFLYHLTQMLKDSANHHLIEWDAGRIVVHDPSRLEAEVLGRYFRHCKYSSFQRQLNYFGFSKVSGKRKMSPCSYTNEAATEELSSLVHLKRKTAKKQPKRTSEIFPLNHLDGNTNIITLQDESQKANQLSQQYCLAAPSTDESEQIATKVPPPMFGNQPFVVSAEEYGAPGGPTSPVASTEVTPSLFSLAFDGSKALSQAIGVSQLQQVQQNISLPPNPLLFLPNPDESTSTQEPSDAPTNQMNDIATFLTLESFFGGDVEDEASTSDGSEGSSWLPDPLCPTIDTQARSSPVHS